ncbi:MAG: HNH endonuclease [Acidobacteria bacterium]|nr:HNH endonuclease [Acidobacteriota bacterium]
MDSEFLDRLAAAQQDRCFYCERPMGQDMVIEHLTPIARGGTNAQENIVLACWDCNDKKFLKTAEEFQGLQ